MKDKPDLSLFTDELSKLTKTGFFLINLCDMSCQYANDEWYKSFGIPVGMSVREILDKYHNVHPVDKYSIRHFCENALKGYEKQYQGYLRVRIAGQDLDWRWYKLHILVTEYAPERGVVEITGVQNDITSEMVNNDTSTDRLCRITNVLQSFNTVPWEINFKTDVIKVNRSYVGNIFKFDDTLQQYSREELLEKVHPDNREELLNIIAHLRSREVTQGRIELQMIVGLMTDYMWVELSFMAHQYDDNGELETAIGACTIIHKRKLAELAMRDAQLKAEHANKVKSAFLANMSHEFRTPLNSILGFSTIMAHTMAMDEKMQCLGAIQSSGSILLQLIEDVLEYAQIESGGTVLKQDRIDVKKIVERTIEEISPKRKEGVEMSFSTDLDSLEIRGDERKVKSVMKHLVGNAAKYTEKGRIDVSLKADKDYATITVKDTGIGMSKEDIAHMFDKFYKGSQYVPGTGLGLCIVKNIVEMWNGKISVESEYGHGTAFSFTIPLFGNYY